MRAVTGAPSISVVITTTLPWPEVEVALRSVYAQALAAGGEVIVADGSGGGLLGAHDFPAVRLLELPGKNVFRLRAAGLRAARASIVALTEDHCRASADWCARILAAHEEHPEADVIGGGVENGASRRSIDWANFFVSNAPYLPPVELREGPDITGQANVSYKRRVLARYPDDALDEGLFRRQLAAAGGKLIVDDRIVVEHVQSLSAPETLAIHYHDGRCVAAAARARSPGARAWLGIAKGLAWPLRVPLATGLILARIVTTRPAHARTAILCAPWLLAVIAAHKAGELVGSIAGAGKSPDRMR